MRFHIIDCHENSSNFLAMTERGFAMEKKTFFISFILAKAGKDEKQFLIFYSIEF